MWTWEQAPTAAKCMLLDLQGLQTADGSFWLSDPALQSNTYYGGRFGEADCGEVALATFRWQYKKLVACLRALSLKRLQPHASAQADSVWSFLSGRFRRHARSLVSHASTAA